MKADCISCGMPAAEVEKHGIDIGKEFCGYCADAEGKLKSFGEVLSGYAHWMMGEMKISEQAAYRKAMEAMEHLPAWRDKHAS